jgi:hypothetical protein
MRLLVLIALIGSFFQGAAQSYLPPPSFIPIQVGKLWGYCDSTAKMKLPAKWEGVWPFTAGVATFIKAFGKDSVHGGWIVKYGLIDTAGNELVPPEYDMIYTHRDGSSDLKQGRSNSFRFPDGRIFTSRKFDIQYRFKESLFVAVQKRKWGIVDTNESIVVPFKYQQIGRLDENGMAVARTMDGHSGILDSRGKFTRFDDVERGEFVSDFNEGLASVWHKDRKDPTKTTFGFVNKEGKLVIPRKFSRVAWFSDGFCSVVTEDGDAQFIDRQGKPLVTYPHGHTGRFQNGYGDFFANGECGLIDTAGKVVLKVKGDGLIFINSNFIIVQSNEGDWGHIKYRLIDITGRQLLPSSYPIIGLPEDGLFWVSDKEDGYYMDMQFHAYRCPNPTNH